MNELDYDCGRFDGRVKTLDQWEKEHASHGEPTFEAFHKNKPLWKWRVCPCGAKHLEDEHG